MRVTITSKLVGAKVPESTAFTVIASFFDDTNDVWATSTPTTAKYRIDRINGDPSCWQQILDWTTLSAATSISIPITSTDNAIQNDNCHEEMRQITVKANDALSTQYQGEYRYRIVNLAGQS